MTANSLAGVKRMDQTLVQTEKPVVWTNDGATSNILRRPVMKSLMRGAKLSCPNCGSRTLFSKFLKVADVCKNCGEELHHQRADDAPPYFTMLIVGHLVVPMIMSAELLFEPPLWLHLAIWLPLTVVLCLALLPPIKGALVALQWALKMHGFDESSRDWDNAREGCTQNATMGITCKRS